MTDELIIQQTKNWIKNVVMDCNFCPFAARALLKESIRYSVITSTTFEESLKEVTRELIYLDNEEEIETTFIIFSNNYNDFDEYLHLLDNAERILITQGYEGIYQLASFHPQYCFAGSDENDPANYTNRSIYPMLHLLREDSITKALEFFPDAEKIPENNIAFAQEKGLLYLQLLRAGCMR